MNWSVSPTSIGSVNSSGVFTPASTGTATVKAASTQDSTKSGTATVTVATQSNVSILPTSAQVQVFHSQQFSATVNGSSSAAVIWEVNGVPGGNLTVGQIDSTGFYIAPNALPSPPGVTVTATSQTDATQSATASVTVLPDTGAPSILSTTPTANQTGIALDSTVQIQFSEAINPDTINPSTVALSSEGTPIGSSVLYNPATNIVTITPTILLTPGAQYSVAISNVVADPAGTPIASSSTWSFTAQPVSGTNGVVSTPPGTDPTTLTVVSYAGQQSTPDGQGNFVASVTPLGSTLLAALVPGKSFAWSTFAGDLSQGTNAAAVMSARHLLASQALTHGHRSVFITKYQITATPLAGSSPNSIAIDSQTTAESILFMTPYLYTSNPTLAANVQAAIAADPNTALLAAALVNAASEADPLSDATVQSDLLAAIVSVTNTLNKNPTPQLSAAERSKESRLTIGRPASESSVTNAQASSSGYVIVATPNCWNWTSSHISPVATGQLQCLDLEYINVIAQSQPQNNTYTINLQDQSCPTNEGNFPFATGCDIDWIAITGPISTSSLPPNGASAIEPGQDAFGPNSPEGEMLSCSTSGGTSILGGSCSVLMLTGQSTFSAIDPSVGFADIVAYDFDLSDNTQLSSQFTVPANSSGTYALRAYSGGFADSDELQNLKSGNYGVSSPTWNNTALALNIAHMALNDNVFLLASTGNGQNIDKCVWDLVVHEGEVFTIENQFQNQNFDNFQDTVSLLSTDVNQLSQDYAVAAKQCVQDQVESGVWDWATKINVFFTAANTALQTVAMVGDAGQHITELASSASPIETAVVSVSSASGGAPAIVGLAPSPVIGSSDSTPVTIIGSGFVSGAKVYWKPASGVVQGPFIPDSTNPTTIAIGSVFGNQTASWQVEVVNPDGTASNWWPFQVTAQGSLLSAPLESAPANGATGISATPTFSWSAVAGANRYWLMVATSPSALPTSPNATTCSGCLFNSLGVGSLTGTSFMVTSTASLTAGATYYWQVQGYTWSGTAITQEGQFSPLWSFATQSAAPLPAPVQSSPANGATGVSTTPTFSWNAVTGVNRYWLMVATSPSALPTISAATTCSGCLFNSLGVGSLTGTSFTVPSVAALSPNTTYYWQVQGYTWSGTAITQNGQFSPQWSLTTQSTALLPAPVQSSPANGATGISTAPTFSWSAVAGANRYWLMVATSASSLPTSTSATTCSGCLFNSLGVGSLTGTSFTVPNDAALSPNTIFYWQVQGYTWSGTAITQNGQFSPQWSFTTQSTALLPAPVQSSPTNGVTGISTAPTFSWSAVTGANRYWLMVATSLSALPTSTSATTCSGCLFNSLGVGSLTGTSFTVPTSVALSPNTTYYWQVQSYTWSGTAITQNGQFSSQWSFTTQSTSVQIAPVPISPGSTSSPGPTLTTLTPTFAWSAVTGATGYGVYVKDVASGVLVYSNDSVGNITSLVLPSGTLVAGESYVWNMRASNAAGFGAYSAQYYFVEQAAVPGTPVPISPGSSSSPGPTLTTLSPTFSWSAVTGATGYGVYVKDVASGVLVYNNDSVGNITTLVLPSGTLVAGESYVWNMRASNTAGFGAYSAQYYFVEQAAVPGTPVPISPGSSSSPGPTLTTLSPTFSWSVVTGATGYGVYVKDVASGVLVYNNDSVGNITTLVLPSGTLVAGHSYVWNMRASNAAGFGAYSTQYYFVEQASVPGTPAPISPGSTSSPGPTLTTLSPTFSWSVVTGATGYGVYVKDVASGVLVYNNDSVGNITSLVLPSGTLVAGESYVWNMRASNAAGFGAYSAQYYFVEQATVPGTPAPISPGSTSSPGPTLTTLTPTFAWSAVTGATGYGVYVKDVASGALVYNNDSVGNITSLVLPSGTLVAGHSYVWNMRASNAAGFGAYSAQYYFVEQAATVPAAPVPISPGSTSSPGPTLTTLSPTFAWSAVSGATGYGVYVKDVASGVLVYNNDSVGNITSLVLPSGTLVAGHSYVWNMRASNSAGFSAFSAQYYFKE